LNPDQDLKQGFYKVNPAIWNGSYPDPNPVLTKSIVEGAVKQSHKSRLNKDTIESVAVLFPLFLLFDQL